MCYSQYSIIPLQWFIKCFSILADEMPAHKACMIVHSPDELARACDDLLSNADKRKNMQDSALSYVQTKQASGLGQIMDAIEPTCKNAKIL